MQRTADVVIIGGGILGASLLYYLTSKGISNVVLLEKGELASGSTGDSAALVRQHYSNEVSIRLVKKSVEIFQNFPDLFDGAQVFTNSGWYFLVPPEASANFRANLARLQRLGIETWEVSVAEAARELPGLNPEGIGHIAFEPGSGYADPVATVKAMAAKAQANGAAVYSHTPARGIKLSGGRISAVVTGAGEISTPVAVNAAGPWARTVGQWVGLDLPLHITREPEATFRPPAGGPALRYPISNMVDRTYFRPMADGTVLIGTGHPKTSEPADPEHYRREVDQKFIDYVGERLAYRLAGLAGSTFVAGWAGLYTVTPDWNMILGRSPDIEGFYLAVGGSGHSFKIGPAMGLCLAELIVDGQASTVDISPLRASRFAEGALLVSTYGGNRA
jgi:sarcosine oxidase subunit beta